MAAEGPSWHHREINTNSDRLLKYSSPRNSGAARLIFETLIPPTAGSTRRHNSSRCPGRGQLQSCQPPRGCGLIFQSFGVALSCGMGCVDWQWLPQHLLLACLFPRDDTGVCQVNALPLPAKGGSSVVSLWILKIVSSRWFCLPLLSEQHCST